MPRLRCKFCTSPPLEEVAVSTWTSDPTNVTRETVQLCIKHLARVKKAGTAGHLHKGVRYKTGFW